MSRTARAFLAGVCLMLLAAILPASASMGLEPTPASASKPWGSLPPVWFVGDSLAVGMHSRLGRPKDWRTARVGARSHHIVPKALDRMAERPDSPRLIVVSLGTNNSRLAVPEFRQDVESFLAATTDRCVLWLTIHRSEGRANWNALNAVLLQAAAKYPHVRILDWHEYASFTDGATSPDGIHMAGLAYSHLRDAVSARFQRCLDARNVNR